MLKINKRDKVLAPDSFAHCLILASEILVEISNGNSFTQVWEVFKRHNQDDSQENFALVRRLVGDSLRSYGRGSFFCNKLMKKPPHSALIEKMLLIAIGAIESNQQKAFMIVDQCVEASTTIKKGVFSALVNGVLRNFLRQMPQLQEEAKRDLQAKWQHPKWWVIKLKEQYPKRWKSILETSNARAPMSLRVNQQKMSPAQYLKELHSISIEAQIDSESGVILEQPYDVSKLPLFYDGVVSVQDIGAQMATELMDINDLKDKDGIRVLDACAAPGGKTCHILEKNPSLNLLALDISKERLGKVGENLIRLGLKAQVCVGDASEKDWWDGGLFDRILADMPCSASGIVRRQNDIKWLRRQSDLPALANRQREILQNLSHMLAVGGKILYATCSIFSDENEMVVNDFLKQNKDFSLCLQRALLPCHKYDGFYYALIERM